MPSCSNERRGLKGLTRRRAAVAQEIELNRMFLFCSVRVGDRCPARHIGSTRLKVLSGGAMASLKHAATARSHRTHGSARRGHLVASVDGRIVVRDGASAAMLPRKALVPGE